MEAADPGLKNVDEVTIAANPVYSWSVGRYIQRFFDELKNGKFMGVKCSQCGRVYLPENDMREVLRENGGMGGAAGRGEA